MQHHFNINRKSDCHLLSILFSEFSKHAGASNLLIKHLASWPGAARPRALFYGKMTKKKFVLRIEEDLYTAVEQWAADEFRSVNGQLEWLVFKMLKDAGRLKKEQEQRPPQPEG